MRAYQVMKGPILPNWLRSSRYQYEGPAPPFLTEILSVLDTLVVAIDLIFVVIGEPGRQG